MTFYDDHKKPDKICKICKVKINENEEDHYELWNLSYPARCTGYTHIGCRQPTIWDKLKKWYNNSSIKGVYNG